MTAFDPDGPAEKDAGVFGTSVAPKDAALILIPIPFDATTSFHKGTAKAPAAIVQASHQIDLFVPGMGRPTDAGICMLNQDPAIESLNTAATQHVAHLRTGSGTADAVDTAGDRVNHWLRHNIDAHRPNQRIGIVGGDHATPYASMVAHAERYPDMAILHIDAHADLREAYEGMRWSHASIMHNVLQATNISTLVQVGVRDLSQREYERCQSDARIICFFGEELDRQKHHGMCWAQLVDRIVQTLPHHVYISFDMDGLDMPYCPHSGTPVPGGISFGEAIFLLESISKSGHHVVGFDLTEVGPNPYDANIGARLMYRLCAATLAWDES